MSNAIAQAFVSPDIVATSWSKLVKGRRSSAALYDAISEIGVSDPETIVPHCALLTLEDLDVFPMINLGADPGAETCTTDLPLRAWLKRRLRERGSALVTPARSLTHDVIGNLYLHYVRDGRHDWLRGAGNSDGGLPLGLFDAQRALTAQRVELIEGFVASVVARATTDDAIACVGVVGTRQFEEVAAWLRDHKASV